MDDAHFDALNIRLTFHVGDAMVTLADLRKMGPGTLVTLDRPKATTVDILVNDRRIGTGEVVTVDGKTGIEIRTLFQNG
ncbi:FliM/FliN family flagellar motor switch protein [Falsirhodobacter sp. 20TX0035]|uniref:FliM/FliN family flagellar motor switch protein n=1 Tax=Falsirhodobacter sp. 20TX0035 TaxID=3022019 RepID=UPI00232B7312|nr:FliM/FliN family flagellar motor switch protein [Falsirhodobacter sp. 20TX0035]MDB6453124.1 FliM/FliN family flagellar motor switch protein [Falsirhodobacter sp. 20TX0035]